MVNPFPAITIKEPWCSAIAYGAKRVENRTWPTGYRGLIALHAGRSIDRDAPDMAWRAASLTSLRDVPARDWRAWAHLGSVIAVAELTGCHDATIASACSCSPWAAPRSWHWELSVVRPLPEPVPCRGMPGLWRLPEDVEAQVCKQLETTW